MNRLEELLENLQKKEEDRPKNTILWILAVIGAVTAVAGIAYAVYRYFTPDYMEAVSYTHLDVYKRQVDEYAACGEESINPNSREVLIG